jgi:hypothetical protein
MSDAYEPDLNAHLGQPTKGKSTERPIALELTENTLNVYFSFRVQEKGHQTFSRKQYYE